MLERPRRSLWAYLHRPGRVERILAERNQTLERIGGITRRLDERGEANDRYRRALWDIANVLGWERAGNCANIACEGCRQEMAEAARDAMDALGVEDAQAGRALCDAAGWLTTPSRPAASAAPPAAPGAPGAAAAPGPRAGSG